MAAYTWTKSKCRVCGMIERYRGKPSCSTRCFTCGSGDSVRTIEIHWGKEKYAGSKAGMVEKFPIGQD